MTHKDDSMDPNEAARGGYNAPPETPREEIWKAIESKLEEALPEETLRAMRATYHSPPEAPRDEMWTEISVEMPKRGRSVPVLPFRRPLRTLRRLAPSSRWGLLATAAAALMVMGIGLGRLSVSPTVTPAETGLSGEAGEITPPPIGIGSFRAAAVGHLSRTESLLTMVSSDSRTGTVDAEVSEWARSLLLQTRLLIDSPASDDPVFLELFEDLEIILMQVARLSPDYFDEAAQRGELGFITEALNDNDMMLRIRSALPIGPIQAGI
jgi:hypothetical protein